MFNYATSAYIGKIYTKDFSFTGSCNWQNYTIANIVEVQMGHKSLDVSVRRERSGGKQRTYLFLY